jgi:hypothetical protein
MCFVRAAILPRKDCICKIRLATPVLQMAPALSCEVPESYNDSAGLVPNWYVERSVISVWSDGAERYRNTVIASPLIMAEPSRGIAKVASLTSSEYNPRGGR